MLQACLVLSGLRLRIVHLFIVPSLARESFSGSRASVGTCQCACVCTYCTRSVHVWLLLLILKSDFSIHYTIANIVLCSALMVLRVSGRYGGMRMRATVLLMPEVCRGCVGVLCITSPFSSSQKRPTYSDLY